MKGKTILLALGGNAILQPGQEATYDKQVANIRVSAERLADLVEQGHRLIITHGNGPQVGNLLRQNEEAQAHVPSMPLHILNSQSQGFLGYMLQQCLQASLERRSLKRNVICLMTRILVDRADPAFEDPTKPVGMFYTQEEAEALQQEKHWIMKQDANRGWRRVVPSPKPQAVLELDAINNMVDKGFITIACGGGGIPVVPDAKGGYEGVEAVVDKDLSSALLAESMHADMFVIITDVDNVYVEYGTPHQRALSTVTMEEMEQYQASGEFSKGSMGPKVEAVLNFTRSTGKPSMICSLDKIGQAVAGNSGTRILAERRHQEAC